MNWRNVEASRGRRVRKIVFRAAYYLFLTGGIAALIYAGSVVVNARRYQARAHAALEESRAEKRSLGLSAPPLAPVDGGAIGELEIARLGLNVVISQGDSPGVLRRAIGHLSGTALPGESGNVVLAGHRDTFFRPLRFVRSGDTLAIKTLQGDFQYEVESVAVVPPSDVSVMQQSSVRTLTLITCFPFYYVGPAPKRFIVRARQIASQPD